MIHSWTRVGDAISGAVLFELDAIAAMTATDATQVNSLWYDGTSKLYAGANNHPTTPAVGYIIEFDVEADGSLTYVDEYSTEAFHCEGCSGYGGEFFVVYHNGHFVSRYNSSWVLQERHTLPDPDPGDSGTNYYQGCGWRSDVMFVNCHGSNPLSPYMIGYKYAAGAFTFEGEYQPPIDCTQGFFFLSLNKIAFAVRTANTVGAPNDVDVVNWTVT